MLKFSHVFCVIVIFIVFLFYLSFVDKVAVDSEKFDTYYQHDAGAVDIMDSKLDQNFASELKYNWNKKDKFGYNVYDKLYDKDVFYRNRAAAYPYDYDLKFTTRPLYDLSHAAAVDMVEPQTYTTFRDNVITLQQKNKW